MGNLLIADRHFHGEGCHLVRTVDDEVLRRILKLGEGGTHVDLDHLGCALAHLYVVDAAHVLHDIVGEVVACHLDALVGDDASE